MKKLYSLVIVIFAIFMAIPAKAVCPVCIVAVGAGVGLSRWLGIDDAITGLWIGGLTLSVSMWTLNWLDKKNYNFFGKRTIVYVGYYALVVIPLYWKELVGHPFNKLWGIDKLVLGIAIGSAGFWAGERLNSYLKKRNGGKVYFPFQKVIIPVSILLILSAIFYFITK